MCSSFILDRMLMHPCAVINASACLHNILFLPRVHCLAPYYTISTAVSFSVKVETDTDISTMGTQHFYSDISNETILHSPMPCSHWKLPNKAIEIFDCLLRLDKTIIRTSHQQTSKFDVNRFRCLLPSKGWDKTGELWCLNDADQRNLIFLRNLSEKHGCCKQVLSSDSGECGGGNARKWC